MQDYGELASEVQALRAIITLMSRWLNGLEYALLERGAVTKEDIHRGVVLHEQDDALVIEWMMREFTGEFEA